MVKHIFIIGSRGLPAKYGGFETFVEELVKHQKNENIKYHVACQSENSDLARLSDGHFDYLGADCFAIDVPNIGPARVIAYDILAIKKISRNHQTRRNRKAYFLYSRKYYWWSYWHLC